MSTPLAAEFYVKAFSVLEELESSSNLGEFKGALVDSLSRTFRIQNVTYRSGPTFQLALQDPGSVETNGPSNKSAIKEYAEKWFEHDGFLTPQSRQALAGGRIVLLDEIEAPTAGNRRFVDVYMRRWGVEFAAAMSFEFSPHDRVVVGLYNTNPIDPCVLQTLRLLRSHLPHVARSIAFATRQAPPELSPRQLEVAELVAIGKTNAAIGRQLYISEDTVKKHVSRILEIAGCASRTELAVQAIQW